jgi:hypothetical protein
MHSPTAVGLMPRLVLTVVRRGTAAGQPAHADWPDAETDCVADFQGRIFDLPVEIRHRLPQV